MAVKAFFHLVKGPWESVLGAPERGEARPRTAMAVGPDRRHDALDGAREVGLGEMKIEVAESLAFSWLRHVRGCAVTQLSWKPSPSWPLLDERALRQDFERIRRLVSESIALPVFSQVEFTQFVRQAEIDVLGVRSVDDPAAAQAIAVDTAFHEAGLNYASAEQTVGRVLKKLIRAALAVNGYLKVGEAHIVFATPKVAEAIGSTIQRYLGDLEGMFAEQLSAGARLRFRLIANRDFASEIMQPVLDVAGGVADTSELFLRAQQLNALCERPTRSPRCLDNGAGCRNGAEGIGAHVRATMADLAASGRLTPEIVAELSTTRYCRQRFSLGYPFLKPVDPALDLPSQRRDHNGYARYWKDALSIGDRRFLVCHEWFERQRTAFDQWVRDLR
jgi:hypothetical protein